jgi:outer membrane protein
MKKKYVLSSLILLALSTSAFAAPTSYGVVNFANCITESKLGKQEQGSFEVLKKQMSAHLEETEKQLSDLSTKFNDPDYLDGLSPEAEEELKTKFRTLNDELNRTQNQYYQVLNQANMRIVQSISVQINSASEKVAKEKKLSMVLNKEACFYYSPELEVTPLVIAEMDKAFEAEMKKEATAPAATPAPAVEKAAPAAAPSAVVEKAPAPAAAKKSEGKNKQ